MIIVAGVIRLKTSKETSKYNANIEYHQTGDSQALHSSSFMVTFKSFLLLNDQKVRMIRGMVG